MSENDDFHANRIKKTYAEEITDLLANRTNFSTVNDRGLFTYPGNEDEFSTSANNSRLVFETNNFNQSELALYMNHSSTSRKEIVPSWDPNA